MLAGPRKVCSAWLSRSAGMNERPQGLFPCLLRSSQEAQAALVAAMCGVWQGDKGDRPQAVLRSNVSETGAQNGQCILGVESLTRCIARSALPAPFRDLLQRLPIAR